MPFATRVIPSRTDVQEIIRNNAVADILEKGAVSNMIGLLQQLNMLSKHAAEAFGNVLKDADKQLGRIQAAKKRIDALEAQVKPVERQLLTNAPSYYYDNPYTDKEWHRRDPLRGLLFRRDKASLEVNRRRQVGDPTPSLGDLDRFGDGSPCIKKYSNPDFFMNQWLEAEKAKMEEARQRRKAKKGKKKKKTAKRVATKRILKVKKKQYSEFGAEFQGKGEEKPEYVEVAGVDLSSQDIQVRSGRRTTQKTGKELKQFQQQQAAQGGGAPPGQAPPNRGPSGNPARPSGGPPGGGGQRPPPMKHVISVTGPGGNPGGAGRPPPPSGLGVPGHKGPQASYAGPQAAVHQIQPSYGNLPGMGAGNPGGGGGGGPPAAPRGAPGGPGGPPPRPQAHVATSTEVDIPFSQMTPQMRALYSQRQAEEAMAAQEEARRQAAIQAKQQEAASLMPARGTGFLSQIRAGTSLKKTQTVKRVVPKDPRSNLLAGIRSKQTLRHVDKNEINVKRTETQDQNSSIFAILQRRQLIGESSSEESGSDWGSESD